MSINPFRNAFRERVVEADTGAGLFRADSPPYRYKPEEIEDYYSAYLDYDIIRAPIDDLTEMAGGHGYYTSIDSEGTDARNPSVKAKQIVDEFGRFHSLDQMLPNIIRNMLIAGFCFPPEQEVVTSEGIKPISEVEISDEILTLNGFNFVYETMKRPYKGKLITVYPYRNGLGITMTPDHPVLVVSPKRCPTWTTKFCKPTCSYPCTRKLYKDYTPEWKEAQNLTLEDFVIQPIPTFPAFDVGEIELRDNHYNEPHIIITDDDFFYMLGFFIGDGFFGGRKGENLSFEINKKDKKSIEKLSLIIKKLGRKPRVSGDDGSVTLVFTHTALSQWIREQIGSGCSDKRIPSQWLGLPESKKRAIIQGLLDSDGSLHENRYTLALVNKSIIETAYLMLLSLGKAPSISSKEMPDCVINEKTYDTKTQYVLRLHKKQYDDDICGFFNGYKEQGLLFNGINKIESSDYEGFVYNVAVDNEPHICTLGMLTHNCPVETIIPKNSTNPEKTILKIVHPKTVTKIESSGGVVSKIEQTVGNKTNTILGENLAWFVYTQIANDPRGTSFVRGLITILNTLNDATADVDKILKRYIGPLAIWKTRDEINAIREAVMNREPGEDIFIGEMRQEDVENPNMPQMITIDPRVPYWEYIEYLDRRIYASTRASNLYYIRNATQASAKEMENIVMRHVGSIQRDVKRSVEKYWFKPLVGLPIPKMKFGKEQTGVEDIDPSLFLTKGVDSGLIQKDQYYEILKQMGLNVTPPKGDITPPVKPGAEPRTQVVPSQTSGIEKEKENDNE